MFFVKDMTYKNLTSCLLSKNIQIFNILNVFKRKTIKYTFKLKLTISILGKTVTLKIF